MTLILLYLPPLTYERKWQFNRFIVMQRVVVFFRNGLRTNFFFLEAPTSICKNSLLVTRCALFWNTITFKYRRRAIGFGENKFDNITRYYSVVRSGDTFRLYPWKIFMDYETRLCCKDDCWWITVRSWNELLCLRMISSPVTENSNLFYLAVDSRHFVGAWAKRNEINQANK